MSTASSTPRTNVHRLQVATVLHQFIEEKVLPGTGVSAEAFWKGFDAIVADLAPKNIALLAERDRLQTELDNWHSAHPGPITDMPAYKAFLEKIGYLVESPKKVKISTSNVDNELSKQAGPQLVVPITNARYALNAANARWGSLYDALYGTDVLSEEKGCEKVGKKGGYNPKRGNKVIEYARHVLDRTAPLKKGSHVGSTGYRINKDGELVVSLAEGGTSKLKDAKQLIGYQGEAKNPSSVLLAHNGLHLDLIINRDTTIGKSDAAGVCDLVLEAALSTILDLEDSVAVVDADDKVQAYGNWLGILQGTLTEEVAKGNKTFTRGLNPDRVYTAPNGKKKVTLHGRSLMFVRNVGHLMTNPAITYTAADGSTREIPEGILDAMVTTTISMHDLQRTANERNNVLVGLSCGLRGKAQIGKGMWAMPDLMKAMLEQKIAHPKAGANTAWVPSPTGATLHALHYHQLLVSDVQKELEKINANKERDALLTGLLTIPVTATPNWSAAEKQQELDNNAQGILGYVVRWVDQGVGCSKVPDIHNIGLMEDRATLRISSQHMANWLHHGVVSKAQITETFERMAAVVDKQNAGDPAYKNMAGNFGTSMAYQAACDLVFKGLAQPSGYTEPLLHAWRLKVKAAA
ncbi:MAG: hypothetical protein HXX19_00065 [Rhodoferax sp.]|nr:hypothetical protein [Rhodoferax sp.]